MRPDDDPFFENLARELKKDPVGEGVDSRIMGAVRRTGMARWPRLLMPSIIFVSLSFVTDQCPNCGKKHVPAYKVGPGR